MPELKNTFVGGRMEKDLDERIVPSNLYREALNINISTSEDSDVGAAQNILGNTKVTSAVQGDWGCYDCKKNQYISNPPKEPIEAFEMMDINLEAWFDSVKHGVPCGNILGRYFGTNNHIASIADPQTDMIYRFVATNPINFDVDAQNYNPVDLGSEWTKTINAMDHGVWMDRIVEYDTTQPHDAPWYKKEKSVMVDIYRVRTTIIQRNELPECNKTEIVVCGNTYQLREGMVIKYDDYPSPQFPDNTYIETISWNSTTSHATILLSVNVDNEIDTIGVGANIYFNSDRVLNFSPDRLITGINIIDGMIFWTDNYSEPKKVHIKRGKLGSNSKVHGTGFGFDPSGNITYPGGMSSPITYGCYGLNSDACYSDFDQHTKLIISGIPAMECDKDTKTCAVYGCMDLNATNFNPNATHPDGSCTYPTKVIGCSDIVACNYNSLANADCLGTYFFDGGNDTSCCLYPNEPCEQCDGDCCDGTGTIQSLTTWGTDGTTWCGNWDCSTLGFYTDACAGDGTVNIQAYGSLVNYLTVFHGLMFPAFHSIWKQQIYETADFNTPVNAYHYWDHEISDTYTDPSCDPPGHVSEYNNAYFSNFHPQPQPNAKQTCIDLNPPTGNHRFKSRIIRMELWEVLSDTGQTHGAGQSPGSLTGYWGYGEDNTWNGSPWFDVPPLEQKIAEWDLKNSSQTPQQVMAQIQSALGLHQTANTIFNSNSTPPFRITLGDVSNSRPNPSPSPSTPPFSDASVLNWADIQNTLINGVWGEAFLGNTQIWLAAGSSPTFGTTNTRLNNDKGLRMFLNIVSEPCDCTDLIDVPCIDDNNVNQGVVWAQTFNSGPVTCVPDSLGTYISEQDCIDTETEGCLASSPIQWNSNFRDIDDLLLPSPLKEWTGANWFANLTHEPQIVVNPIRGTFPLNFAQLCHPVFVQEKHITVIKKNPTSPPKIRMDNWADDADINADEKIILQTTFAGQNMPRNTNFDSYHSMNNTGGVESIPDASGNACAIPVTSIGIEKRGKGIDGSNVSIFYDSAKNLLEPGDKLILPIDINNISGGQGGIDWSPNDNLKITHTYTDSNGNTITAVCRVSIINPTFTFIQSAGYCGFGAVPIQPTYNTDVGPYNTPGGIECLITHISPNLPILAKWTDVYTVTKEQKPPLFETKFPKFSYRYKYEDGEYSTFAPWSEIAFIPGKFDYLPKKGYNLGMVNNMRSLVVLDWNPKNRPKDVLEIDLLYKESNSPNVYTVKTFKPSDPEWMQFGTGDNQGSVNIQSELIHKTVPSNQTLRPWDNVPRRALGQEITANRLIYANYLQNYDMRDDSGINTKPTFSNTLISVFDENLIVKEPVKSLKSMRNYQIGIVYRDRYGRETPVLTDPSGSIDIDKKSSRNQNQLSVQLSSTPPSWAESYTFYVKETSNEYYNLAMDRWYNADDDGVWISFPSSERNKLSERSILLLKKQHNSDTFVDTEIKYKVLDIKNNAPNFIKTDYRFWGTLPMMLAPPGWGVDGKAGTATTGMFHSTGLPLPNRLYLDIYAEYFDQSVLANLTQETHAQIRVVQSNLAGSSGYNTAAIESLNKSKWYDIANVSYIGSPPETYEEEITDPTGAVITQELEVPGQAEQIVRITLEDMLGSDVGFCQPLDNLSLNRGIALEVRTATIRDKAQFQGRFFVKILRDAEIQSSIVLAGQQASETWQVLSSRDVKYIAMAHPGVQEWRTDGAGTHGGSEATAGTSFGRWYKNTDKKGNISSYNYLPIGKEWAEILVEDAKCEVSSYHGDAGDATYRNRNNTLTVPPINSGSFWPMGAGYRSNPVFKGGWWYTYWYDFIDRDMASEYQNCWDGSTVKADCDPGGSWAGWAGAGLIAGSIWPDIGTQQRDWPSFATDKNGSGVCDDSSSTDGCANLDVNDFPGGDTEGIIDFSLINNDQTVIPGSISFGASGIGASPLYVPAIWGNQNDILGYELDVNGNKIPNAANNIIPAQTYPSTWRSDTIEKLRSGFYYLYHGQDKVDKKWPLGRIESERWFIDKCGAAQGYSGAGIWDVDVGGTTTSRMDLSFYGIGKMNFHQRDHDLANNNDSASSFGELMATVGTQFRFQQDPNQTVYTIVEVKVSGNENKFSKDIFNYEAPHGSWGYDDGSGGCEGGGGFGSSKCPPFGSSNIGVGNLPDKSAFHSDVFSEGQYEKTGGALYNYRQRITITLNKEIGSEGANYGSANMGFHPIKNHVDVDGNCNIKGGAKRYSSLGAAAQHEWMVDAGTFPESIGGIPNYKKYFNLSSYWNRSSDSGTGQSDQKSQTDFDAGEHFGLHERGLNSTTIEVITPFKGDEPNKVMSKNPAIFETEPMEDVGLDIYYAASPTYPINLERIRSDKLKPDFIDFDIYGLETDAHYFNYNWRGEEVIPVGAWVEVISWGGGPMPGGVTLPAEPPRVTGVQGNRVWVDGPVVYNSGTAPINQLQAGWTLKFYWKGEGNYYGARSDDQFVEVVVKGSDYFNLFIIEENTHNLRRSLNYHNCYSFLNGVESNRIRDDYNAVTIDKGVKASMPLAEGYEEDRKASSLIFSGIYNSTSGVNRLNQFIQAEPITKDLNPANGSIQKLFARDTDLVTFCENKVFKILANKDALFSAGGDTNLTSTNKVLGNATPFVGEYGISKNPESFASQSYRVYFSDKTRGAILRLSRDGLTPISDKGMKDWFRDNLFHASKVVGSYDDRQDQYNVSIETADQNDNKKAYTLSYVEEKRGWESFKSFIHEDGLSHKNNYFTFTSNNYAKRRDIDPWGGIYSWGFNLAEMWQHNIDIRITRVTTKPRIKKNNIFVSKGVREIYPGMNVEGNGIPHGTFVTAVIVKTNDIKLKLSNDSIFIDKNEEVLITSPRNIFYWVPTYSMIKTLFNKDQGSVKRFKTLNYEGSQGKIIPKKGGILDPTNDYQLHPLTGPTPNLALPIIRDNWDKEGWYIEKLKTDLQTGSVKEFVDKENKWFNYIKGKEDAGIGDDLDTKDFSLQGLGMGIGANCNDWGIAGVTVNDSTTQVCVGQVCSGDGDIILNMDIPIDWYYRIFITFSNGLTAYGGATHQNNTGGNNVTVPLLGFWGPGIYNIFIKAGPIKILEEPLPCTAEELDVAVLFTP